MNLLHAERVVTIAHHLAWEGRWEPFTTIDNAIQFCLEQHHTREGVFLNLDNDKDWAVLEPDVLNHLEAQ